MKKMKELLILGVLLACSGLVQAEEESKMEATPEKNKLSAAVDVTYVSRYIWRGFDVYGPGAHGAIQPSIDVDLFATGFGFKTWMSKANTDKFENNEQRWDYTLYYQNSVFDGECYATNYRLSWVYYNYPDNPHRLADLQEMSMVLAWPNIFPVKGLVPAYALIKLWPAHSHSMVTEASGFAHVFMLDYGFAICPILPNTVEQKINLHAETIYNDGVDPRPGGPGVDHDWSNAVFGITAPVDIAKNLTFTPGYYYQSSWDDSVNDEDENWVSLSMTYKF